MGVVLLEEDIFGFVAISGVSLSLYSFRDVVTVFVERGRCSSQPFVGDVADGEEKEMRRFL